MYSGARAHWPEPLRRGRGCAGSARSLSNASPEVLTSASREFGNAKTVQVGRLAVSGRTRGRILAEAVDPLVLPTPSLFCFSPVQSAFPLADTVRIALVISSRSFLAFRRAKRSWAFVAQIATHSSRPTVGALSWAQALPFSFL